AEAVKKTFGAFMPRDTMGFYPDKQWSEAEVAAFRAKLQRAVPQVLGLITSTGAMYSILVFNFQDNMNEWVVAGAKRAQPLNYAMVRKVWEWPSWAAIGSNTLDRGGTCASLRGELTPPDRGKGRGARLQTP